MNKEPSEDLRADTDALISRVDALCDLGDWETLAKLRRRCRDAVSARLALWPVIVHAEHRLALEAEPRWAALVAVEPAGTGAIGPLAEVAASTHSWADLAPYLPHGSARSLVAYERVIRGEDLTDREERDDIDRSMFDLPLRLEPWEPAYPLSTYEARRGIFPSPVLPELFPVVLGDPGEEGGREHGDLTATEALTELVRPWTTESNGAAEAVAVQGDVLDAIGALGMSEVGIARLEPAEAMAHIAWAAASGGAHAPRRGMATGRFNVWWTIAALSDLAGDWPVEPEEIGEAAQNLAWFVWDLPEPMGGWSLRLAVADAASGTSWALAASDRRLDR